MPAGWTGPWHVQPFIHFVSWYFVFSWSLRMGNFHTWLCSMFPSPLVNHLPQFSCYTYYGTQLLVNNFCFLPDLTCHISGTSMLPLWLLCCACGMNRSQHLLHFSLYRLMAIIFSWSLRMGNVHPPYYPGYICSVYLLEHSLLKCRLFWSNTLPWRQQQWMWGEQVPMFTTICPT